MWRATRQSVEDCMNRCEDAILYANEQLDEALRQGFYQDAEFSEAQAGLEQAVMAVMELEKLKDSSNAQQP